MRSVKPCGKSGLPGRTVARGRRLCENRQTRWSGIPRALAKPEIARILLPSRRSTGDSEKDRRPRSMLVVAEQLVEVAGFDALAVAERGDHEEEKSERFEGREDEVRQPLGGGDG